MLYSVSYIDPPTYSTMAADVNDHPGTQDVFNSFFFSISLFFHPSIQIGHQCKTKFEELSAESVNVISERSVALATAPSRQWSIEAVIEEL